MGVDVSFKWNKPIPQIVKEATGGEKTLLFMATAWHRLYFPWIPADAMMLAENVDYLVEDGAGIIHHKVPYANRQYNGDRFNFRKDKHPLSSAHWDQGAIQAGKGKILARDTQAFIKRGG